MSKIGKKPILIPEGVKLDIAGSVVTVVGPKGEEKVSMTSGVELSLTDNIATVKTEGEDMINFGRIRSEIANAVYGVNSGWEKNLEIVGTGYRAATDGKKLTLSLGFSHPVEIVAPEGISFAVAQSKIKVAGVNKYLVGQVAAKIRDVRPPDSYKGKGIRYEGEIVRKKAGKAAKGAAGGAA
ncbi:50S ribosomal protein L6 [Candidatus Microgenomates bacterium]|nr:50S ribosomal protein L6 [Candidatus Microgenomates bacterium]